MTFRNEVADQREPHQCHWRPIEGDLFGRGQLECDCIESFGTERLAVSAGAIFSLSHV